MKIRHEERGALFKKVAGLIVLSLIGAALLPAAAAAAPPFPLYGVRVVDGEIDDWKLARDFYDYMYRAGREEKRVESWLYLRYDCRTFTLYILVRSRPNVPILAESIKGAWVAIDSISKKQVNAGAGNDGVPPDFAWIGLTETPNGKVAYGFEASMHLDPGSYTLIAHVDVLDDDSIQTSATIGSPKRGIPITVDCAVPVQDPTWGAIKSLYK